MPAAACLAIGSSYWKAFNIMFSLWQVDGVLILQQPQNPMQRARMRRLQVCSHLAFLLKLSTFLSGYYIMVWLYDTERAKFISNVYPISCFDAYSSSRFYIWCGNNAMNIRNFKFFLLRNGFSTSRCSWLAILWKLTQINM